MRDQRQVSDGVRRIYLAPDDHTDYFWTVDDEAYRVAFIEMLDYYLDRADKTATEPPEHQSRWNCDGSYWMWIYEKSKPKADFERLIERIRDGHISVPMNALCVYFGGQPAEAVLRGMYYCGRIERQYGVRFPLAYAIENETMPYGVGALWAGAGAKYSWNGICACHSLVLDAWDRQHEVYWWVGPDGSRLLMKWNSVLGGYWGTDAMGHPTLRLPATPKPARAQHPNQSMGGYAEARHPSELVDYVSNDPEFNRRHPYQVVGAFGQGWDDLKTTDDNILRAAKEKTSATCKVIVSNEIDFFEDIEATHGAQLPSLSVSFGNQKDLYCATIAEVTARVKRALERLRGAEALATLVGLQKQDFWAPRDETRERIWMDLGLYWEHNVSCTGKPLMVEPRKKWARGLATEIETYVSGLETRSAAALGGLIRKSGSKMRFYAFNPLSWTRSDIADLPYTDREPAHVVDVETGEQVPSQVVTVDGERRLRVLARSVPPVGYRVFEVQPGTGAQWSDAASVSGNVVENEFYKITVGDQGAITSLRDKTRENREFAETIDGRAINDLGPGTGTIQVENAGPVSVTLWVKASGPLKHETRISLIRDSRRIDIRNDINESFSDTQTWSFSFAMSSPDVWHEEVGAVLRAKLVSQGGHYATRNARYDWLSLNHFADISDGSVGVTLANADCCFMRLGRSTITRLDTSTPQLSPLAGGRVVIGNNGIPDQGLDRHFLQRFALQTHDAFDAAMAMRFALEHQNPLLTGVITGGAAYPETTYSLLRISDPNVLLWALKPAEDGIAKAGIVTRMWNLSSRATSVELRLAAPFSIGSAKLMTHIETPTGRATVIGGSLTETMAAHQIKTFGICPSNMNG